MRTTSNWSVVVRGVGVKPQPAGAQEGAHLVAGAIKEEGKYEEAARLLKQLHVIDYFIEYVDREGAEKAPDAVIAKLKETLQTLKEVTAKSVIEEADVNTVHSATAAVLTML